MGRKFVSLLGGALWLLPTFSALAADAPRPPARPPAEALAAAKEAYEQQVWDAAATDLNEVSFSDSVRQRRLDFLRGIIAIRRKDFETAIRIYGVNPKADPEWTYHLALATAYAGRLQDAYALLQTIPAASLARGPLELRRQSYTFAAILAQRLQHPAVAWVLYARAYDAIDDTQLPVLITRALHARSSGAFADSLRGTIEDSQRLKILSAETELNQRQPSMFDTDFDLQPEGTPSPTFAWQANLEYLSIALYNGAYHYALSALVLGGQIRHELGAWSLLGNAELGLIELSAPSPTQSPRYFSASAGLQHPLAEVAGTKVNAGALVDYQTLLQRSSSAGFSNLVTPLLYVEGRYPLAPAWWVGGKLEGGPVLLKDSVGFSNLRWRFCAEASRYAMHAGICYDQLSFDAGLPLSSLHLLTLSAGIDF